MAMMSDRKKLERMKELRLNLNNVEEDTEKMLQDEIDNKKKWITYYRNNPEIYIETRLGFHGFGYQNFSYHLMFKAEQYCEVSTRGTGKSLKMVTGAVARALLYPNSKIGITAVGNSQANENYTTAFMQEIVYKYSPFMKWLYDNKFFISKETEKGYLVQFWNGSTLIFFACIDSARGKINKKIN